MHFLDAAYTLWDVSEEDGREKYGENYHSISYLFQFHHFNAAWQDADHIHEGNGFLLQHLKMTNMFETSIQAVDPSVTLPYWDYTIDRSEDKIVSESFIFTEDVFGSMKEPSDLSWGFQSTDKSSDGKIPDGRWKNLKADKNKIYKDPDARYNEDTKIRMLDIRKIQRSRYQIKDEKKGYLTRVSCILTDKPNNEQWMNC